ncbi:bifunctional phosphopantothenoylcysteine decarboxylase/phosphopantothenate--cysteine ligase CoaBC [Marinigracilibium pacificum]|uniref:Coenzyme A biosynthesis bifunctional protein CoaBC n=1 Tax=Marinigracilibium pacificum TaxID=2729599 RepID=A0A848J347_9BACT|nr:bifunctional phosphopantothenoylcysteine decarboxylase/phosphopantothenate--cysteine ligase CoaBC [Marinigracilibium pacificum]NMM50176.1 bifunctional phosphopantothenoylcysteine decarboxylase/phosphopantothenate--cysteine ligase CoaBC [Marinigracilibium pacificum]
MSLKGKKIILGVTGSIAAYKSALLTRLLIKEGAEVKIVMTPSASSFITPLTLATLSKNPVLINFEKNDAGEWNNHVELGLWGDLFIIAPASANTLSKCANGICDNLLIATYLSSRCPVMFSPAMDLDMYKHPSTTKNLETLKSFGNIIIPAGTGELASGLEGEGRMAEPEEIVEEVKTFFNDNLLLKGKKILITAGPTYEKIDPVRFIGNHSSGKMGYAIAEEFANRGAQVTLVSGPVNIKVEHKNITVTSIMTAVEMMDAVTKNADNSEILIFAAAVADYRPSSPANQKIKKEDSDPPKIELIQNPDIALSAGANKKESQYSLGFALETENELINAEKKLEKKNFNAIVLNSLNDQGAGFGHNTNKITIIGKNKKRSEFPLKDKKHLAIDIVNYVIDDFYK